MVVAGRATAAALAEARRLLAVGATPLELDAAADRVIGGLGGRSNFQLVPGYRHTLCVSVDDDIVHGIPGDRPFRAGDVMHSQADITKAGRLLGYVPTHRIRLGLEQTVDWYLASRGHHDGDRAETITGIAGSGHRAA